MKKIFELSKSRNIGVKEMFEKYDEKKTGFITAVDFRTFFRHVGFPLTSEEITSIIDRYNQKDDEKVS